MLAGEGPALLHVELVCNLVEHVGVLDGVVRLVHAAQNLVQGEEGGGHVAGRGHNNSNLTKAM